MKKQHLIYQILIFFLICVSKCNKDRLQYVFRQKEISLAQKLQQKQIDEVNKRYKKVRYELPTQQAPKQNEWNSDQLAMEIVLDNNQVNNARIRASMSVRDGKLYLSDQIQGNACASAEFKDTIMETGWDTLNMEVADYCDSRVGFLAVGYLEGLLSYEKMRHLWRNYIAHNTYHVDEYRDWHDDNGLLKKSYELLNRIDDKFKRVMNKYQDHNEYQSSIDAIRRLHSQQQGILRGFNDRARSRGEFTMTWAMMMIINYDGAIDNVIHLSSNGNSQSRTRFKKEPSLITGSEEEKEDQKMEEYLRTSMRGHCSVLFKKVDNNMLMSHSTWDNYNAMQRIFKYLHVGARKITYSSYPGCISSTDDFFILHGNLMVTETSLHFKDSPHIHSTIFQDQYDYIPEYFQVMSANHLSNTGQQWMNNMQLYKSCLYASQWMVYDQNAFEYPSGSSFLYLMEDGFNEGVNKVISIDDEVNREGFFSSYNIDYEDKKFHTTPRYTAFKHNQGRVVDHRTLQKVMAFNAQKMDDKDYNRMSKSQKHVIQRQLYESVALRIDTVQQDGGFGAIDIKTTDSKMIKSNLCYARNGPVLKGDTKVFQWTDPPEGQPKRWNFHYVLMGPSL